MSSVIKCVDKESAELAASLLPGAVILSPLETGNLYFTVEI